MLWIPDSQIFFLKSHFNRNSKRDMYHNVHCSTICNSQDMEAT